MLSKLNFLTKLDWFKILLESFFIVLGILLAFAVNEWQEAQKKATQRKATLKNIRLEIEQNLQSLQSVQPYHQKGLDSLQALLQLKNKDSIIQNKIGLETVTQILSKGLHPPSLQNTAWETAVVTNSLNLVEIDKVHAISQYYKLQKDGVNKTWELVIKFLFERENFDPAYTSQNLEMIKVFLHEICSQEEFLETKAEETLSLLKK